MAFQSNESGRFEVYVRRVADGGQAQVSTAGGRTPIWSPDGRTLFYESLSQQLMAVRYADSEAAIRFEQPKTYWDKPLLYSGADWNYDVGPAGAVVVLEPSRSATPSNHLVFLVNGIDEIRQRTRSSPR